MTKYGIATGRWTAGHPKLWSPGLALLLGASAVAVACQGGGSQSACEQAVSHILDCVPDGGSRQALLDTCAMAGDAATVTGIAGASCDEIASIPPADNEGKADGPPSPYVFFQATQANLATHTPATWSPTTPSPVGTFLGHASCPATLIDASAPNAQGRVQLRAALVPFGCVHDSKTGQAYTNPATVTFDGVAPAVSVRVKSFESVPATIGCSGTAPPAVARGFAVVYFELNDPKNSAPTALRPVTLAAATQGSFYKSPLYMRTSPTAKPTYNKFTARVGVDAVSRERITAHSVSEGAFCSGRYGLPLLSEDGRTLSGLLFNFSTATQKTNVVATEDGDSCGSLVDYSSVATNRNWLGCVLTKSQTQNFSQSCNAANAQDAGCSIIAGSTTGTTTDTTTAFGGPGTTFSIGGTSLFGLSN